jgi:hypothetical protein
VGTNPGTIRANIKGQPSVDPQQDAPVEEPLKVPPEQ